MGIRLSLIVAAACTLVVCSNLPKHQDFATGMTRTEVRERFGDQLRSREIRKTNEAIWGPIEDFWSQVPMGGTVEIWSYRTIHEWAEGSGNRDTGTTQLYFVDGSPRVSALAFAPDGVVYEAESPP